MAYISDEFHSSHHILNTKQIFSAKYQNINKWQNISEHTKHTFMSFLCVFLILKVFQHCNWGSEPQGKHPPGRVFFDVPFLYQSHPYGWSRNFARTNFKNKKWSERVFLFNWICVFCCKMLSKRNNDNIPNIGNFGQKSYQIQKLWPSLAL